MKVVGGIKRSANRRMRRARSGRLPFFGFVFGVSHRNRRRGGGNVGISPLLRDFQGAVGSGENLGLVFHAFHGPGISTALRGAWPHWNLGGTGDSILHWRSSCALAAVIFRAEAVSLICSAT